MPMHTLRSSAPGACVCMNRLQLFLRVCNEGGKLSDRWKVRFWWRGEGKHLVARNLCWWIFWLTVSPSPPAACTLFCLLFLSTSYTVAAGYGVARARCGEVDSEKKGEEEKTGEREDWQGPGGQLERLCFCFLICIYKMFFSLCQTLYFPHSLFPFTHAASIHSQYYFLFSPQLLPLLRISSTFFSFLFF